jgi:predicted enzyme related to lactoylglutathione lyase
MTVVSTYFMVMVADMERATAFYRDAFGAEVKFASPYWTSLQIAGVAIGLHHGAEGEPREIGLGFDVDDLDASCAAVTSAGGRIVKPPEHKPSEGITIATIADTEGNEFSLTLARGDE